MYSMIGRAEVQNLTNFFGKGRNKQNLVYGYQEM
jgi:hypothetical protein